ncbi:MAG: type IV toxin-antitoxin system AbiEi family antitoxin domain-containing protein [Candidatus Zixiibacteriota bacterium]
MQNVINIFKNHYGYAYLKDLKAHGVHTDTIRKLLAGGTIEKIKPGLYRLADFPIAAHQGFVDVFMAMSKAVICLHSALSYYGLTTTVPAVVMVALPRDAKAPKLKYPPVKVFYFSHSNYVTGAEAVHTKTGDFKIYGVEKTIVDCFRYRNRLGEDVAVEGLKNYLKQKGANLNKLFSYARKGRMYRVIRPYVEALMA